MKFEMRAFAILGLIAGFASSSFAITNYVDATDGIGGNTTLVGGGTWTATTANAVDGLWRSRAFGQPGGEGGGPVFEAGGAGVEDAQRLVTTVSGLTLGNYDVFVYFWGDELGSPWRIRASLTDNVGGELPLFQVGGTLIGSPLPVAVTSDMLPNYSPSIAIVGNATDQSGRVFYQVLLGQVTGVTDFSVYIDNDSLGTDGSDGRTWYDGVGYALVVPEPSSFVIGGLGVVALLAFRRILRAS